MNGVIQGRIVSLDLGEFSKKRIKYGYIGIELPDKTHISVKIDSYTWYETLTTGDEVVMEIHSLGNTDILVARKIQLKTGLETPLEEVSATT